MRFVHSPASDSLESQTLSYILPVYLSALTPPQKHDCRPTNFITTALNCTVLEPSNYSSLRCGCVEKGRKSTEVGAPGLELWENWKQMICPFPCSLLPSPSLLQHLTSLSFDFQGQWKVKWRTKTVGCLKWVAWRTETLTWKTLKRL